MFVFGFPKQPQNTIGFSVEVTYADGTKETVKSKGTSLALLYGGKPIQSLRATASLYVEFIGTVQQASFQGNLVTLFDGVEKQRATLQCPSVIETKQNYSLGTVEAVQTNILSWASGLTGTHTLLFQVPSGSKLTVTFTDGKIDSKTFAEAKATFSLTIESDSSITVANVNIQPSTTEPPPPATSVMTVGVDMWSGTTSNTFTSSYSALMQQCGVQMVRLEFGSGSVSNMRTLVPAVVGSGVKVLGLLMRTDLAPDNVDAWGTWVYSVVSEFKTNVHVWEIWNEPNLDSFFSGKDPVKYTAFLKRGYEQAKLADPTCFVLGGSVAFTHSTAQNFLKTMYANGAKDYMDALSWHPYCNPYAPDDTSSTPNPYIYLTKIRDIMVQNGDESKRIWITEVGWTTNESGQIGETLQAQYITQALGMARDWGWVETFIIYNWKDSTTSGSATKGLLTTSLTPKQSFYAVKDFISGR